jgi:hypothetical protein
MNLLKLKDSKKSNILVALYVDDLKNTIQLEETLYSISKQTYNVDLLVIHPTLSEDNLKSLKECLNDPKIILRTKDEEGKETKEEIIKTEKELNFSLLEENDIKNFPSLFNKGFNIANENGYEFFSIVEPNDIIGLNWYKQSVEYSIENKELSILFPIIRNTANGTFSNLMNEAPWAEGMAEESGKLDINLLTKFNCIVPLSAVFKIDGIKEYSEQKEDGLYYPFKESIKISHYYEFFMRMIYNDVKALCVPRIGYEYKTSNVQSFNQIRCKLPANIAQIPSEKGGISQDEGNFWVKLAKKEYFFDEDRNKEYTPEN